MYLYVLEGGYIISKQKYNRHCCIAYLCYHSKLSFLSRKDKLTFKMDLHQYSAVQEQVALWKLIEGDEQIKTIEWNNVQNLLNYVKFIKRHFRVHGKQLIHCKNNFILLLFQND